jgi:hypothetical protein
VAALDADLDEAGRAVSGAAGRVGGEDAARELVEAAPLRLIGQRVEQLPAQALPTDLAADVDAVLADALVDAAIGVRADAGEADDAPVDVLGDEEGEAGLEPGADLGWVAQAGLERRLALDDPEVVEGGDGLRIGGLGGPYCDRRLQGLRARTMAEAACGCTR